MRQQSVQVMQQFRRIHRFGGESAAAAEHQQAAGDRGATAGCRVRHAGQAADAGRVVRAAREYDGWMASGALTTFRVLAEGIKRYRDAGGRRALVSTIDVDLSAPTTPWSEDDRFSVRCEPAAAADL